MPRIVEQAARPAGLEATGYAAPAARRGRPRPNISEVQEWGAWPRREDPRAHRLLPSGASSSRACCTGAARGQTRVSTLAWRATTWGAAAGRAPL